MSDDKKDDEETVEKTDTTPEEVPSGGELFENPDVADNEVGFEPGDTDPLIRRKKRNKKKNKKNKTYRRTMVCYDDEGQEIDIYDVLKRTRRHAVGPRVI